ncbi:alpha/beta fold hydrolase [Streptomyces buecherae]|uniref:thioesterase II family protein n=1 Tax=Streptomyces buecherae TaxID=2763006 RepID=UPI0033C55DF8
MTATPPQTRWIQGLGSRNRTARLRLYVFPHAGAGASAYRLNRFFPEQIEVCPVQLPGREDRLAELPLTTVPAVIDAAAPAIAASTDLPYAFLGHSMGALLAFHVAHRLRETGAPLPGHLFLSAYRAPHLPERDPVHKLPDAQLLQKMGLPDPCYQDPDLRELFLPALRADVTLCETATHRPAEPLPCPITALCGSEDNSVTTQDLNGWQTYTSAGFRLQEFPGDHFYLRGAEQNVAEYVAKALARPETQKGMAL